MYYSVLPQVACPSVNLNMDSIDTGSRIPWNGSTVTYNCAPVYIMFLSSDFWFLGCHRKAFFGETMSVPGLQQTFQSSLYSGSSVY